MGKGARLRSQRTREDIVTKRWNAAIRWAQSHYGSKGSPEPEEVIAIDYEIFTRDELRQQAKLLDIQGRGSMTKAQLIEAIKAARQ